MSSGNKQDAGWQLHETRVLVAPFRLHKDSHLAEKVDYPAFKGPSAPAATVNGTSVSTAVFPLISRCPTPYHSLSFSFSITHTSVLFLPQVGDKTLAQSAQMFHFQHQKQQMLSMEKY